MRITIGSVAAIAVSVAVCASCSKSKNEAAAPAPQLEAVTAVGCPTPGPQPNCLTIASKGKIYDLASANPPVDMSRGVGISVQARASTGSTPCGLKLQDVKVEYLGIQCAAPTPEPTAPA